MLLGTIEPKTFFKENFGRNLVHIPAAGKNRFSDLFSMKDFNNLLNYSHLTYPRVRVTDNKNTVHKYDLIEDVDRYFNNKNDDIDREKLLYAVARGGTIIIDKIYELNPLLDMFIDSLRKETNIRFGANGYFTPSGSMGVNPHFDRHDVFAIQLSGSKKWYYRDDHRVLSQPMRKQAVPVFGEGWNEVVLQPGDVLYVPRGLWHCTRTDDENSLHIAVGCYPLTLADWLGRVTAQVPEIAELMEGYVQQWDGGTGDALRHQVASLAEMLAEMATKQQGYDAPISSRTLVELD